MDLTDEERALILKHRKAKLLGEGFWNYWNGLEK